MSLVDYPVINIAIGAAILAVIYGLVMSKWIINLPAGQRKDESDCRRYSRWCSRLPNKTI